MLVELEVLALEEELQELAKTAKEKQEQPELRVEKEDEHGLKGHSSTFC
jgi:hypothetical protein